MLAFGLTKLRELLTADHPSVRRILGEHSPEELAKSVIEGTQLEDQAVRHALFDGGATAILASKDPMIQLARALDGEARPLRDFYENEYEPLYRKNTEKVARAQFAVLGTGTYPDATFTLRISYGQIHGYKENGHEVVVHEMRPVMNV